MRVKLLLSSDKPVILSSCYNRSVQGAIYSLLDSDFARMLHDEGYTFGKRRFKLFTFSRLFGKFLRKGDLVEFNNGLSFFLSSPVREIVEQFCLNLAKKGMTLETNFLELEGLEIIRMPEIHRKMRFVTLSPITVYSTLYNGIGKKKTYYYSPLEREFSEIVSSNLSKKATLLGHSAVGSVSVNCEEKPKEVFLNFKRTIVRGWTGSFSIEGDPKLIEIAYETGIGAKNSAGFGMIDFVQEEKI